MLSSPVDKFLKEHGSMIMAGKWGYVVTAFASILVSFLLMTAVVGYQNARLKAFAHEQDVIVVNTIADTYEGRISNVEDVASQLQRQQLIEDIQRRFAAPTATPRPGR
jgi:hypothetical protein